MNQFVLVAILFGLAACGNLDNAQYLPPNQRYNQGGQNAGGQYQGSGGAGSGAAGSAGGYSGGNQYQSAGGKSFERGPNADIPILRLDQQNEGDGNFQYAFETGNGIQATQQGNAQEGAGTNSQGSYSYTSPEGEQIQISYSAGEGGFQAQGSHIPTAPPVPAEIAKALEQNLADEARGIVDDGQYKPEYQNEGNYQQQGGFQQKNQYQGGAAQSNQYIPPSAGQRQGGNAGYKY